MKSSITISILTICFLIIFQSCSFDDTDISNSDTLVGSDKILKILSKGKDLIVVDKTISDDLNFWQVEHTILPVKVSTVDFSQNIVFKNCVFKGDVSAYNKAKNNAITISRFSGNVVFIGCTFEKGVNFIQSDFENIFCFDQNVINGESSFSGTKFNDNASFVQTNFKNDVKFISVTFCSRADLSKIYFEKSSIWQMLRCDGYFLATDSYFYGYTEFSNVDAGHCFDFSNAKFSGRTFFSHSNYFKLKFSGCDFKDEFKFDDNLISGELILHNASFSGKTSFFSNTFFKPVDNTDSKTKENFSIFQHSNNVINASEYKVINVN